MRERKIYPKVDMYFEQDAMGQKIVFRTSLRKKHRGRWYLWDVVENYYHEHELSREELIETLNQFYSQVYKAIMFGKVNLKLIVERNGVVMPVFKLDPDQRAEEERLSLFIKPLNPQK